MNYANVVFKFDMILQDVHYKNANDVFSITLRFLFLTAIFILKIKTGSEDNIFH